MASITSEKAQWFQWDTGLEVTVSDGIDQVHFACSQAGRSLDVDVSGGRARVPDRLLQSARPVRAWGYEVDGAGGRTLVAAEFPVIPRNRPAGYAFAPGEQKAIADAVAAADKAVSARDEARRYAREANDSSVAAAGHMSSAESFASAAGDEADRATERAKDAEAAEGRAQNAVASAAPLVVKVEDNVPAKTFGEMQSAMLAGRPVYWTDGLLTFAAVQMEHGGLSARVGLSVSGGAIASATFWEMAPNAAAITESNYSV